MKHARAAVLVAAVCLAPAAQAQERRAPEGAPRAEIELRPAPDLEFRSGFSLQQPQGVAAPGNAFIRPGQPFWACYAVRNVGNAPTGRFRVSGGLTRDAEIVQSTDEDHAGLGPLESNSRCLYFSTTPPIYPGYWLVLTVDSAQTVSERNEANNTATGLVVVN